MYKICFFKERLQCILYICRVNVLIINVSGVANTSVWTRYWQGSVHTAALPSDKLIRGGKQATECIKTYSSLIRSIAT